MPERLQASNGMQHIEADLELPARLRIQAWRRLLLTGVSLVPPLLILAGLLSQFDRLGWSHGFAVASGLILAAAFFALSAQIRSLASIEIDGEGLSQSFLGLTGFRRRQLRWENVRQVSYERGWYRFHGSDGRPLLLAAMLLPDAQVAVHALRLFMPQRLLAQLGLHRR
ncbi:hypothetical protein [Solimonas fluminis]|uniref:hypothetical protein n=1 Tax=Solimonas fluminis TaxID=2086571 RepID=UPI001056F7BA|nr:hypothetical protein [Solimonas fluminis]